MAKVTDAAFEFGPKTELVLDPSMVDAARTDCERSAYAACILERLGILAPTVTRVTIPRDVLAVLVASAGHLARNPTVRAALSKLLDDRFKQTEPVPGTALNGSEG